MTTSLTFCTRRLSVDQSVENAEVPNRYAGMYSYRDLPSVDVPFERDTDFHAFMKQYPFVVVIGGTTDLRERVAAAILKRTFAFSPTRYGKFRARFADAESDVLKLRSKFYGEDAFDELALYRTYIMLEIQRIEAQDSNTLRRLLWKRQDATTVLTFPNEVSLKNLDDSILGMLSPTNATYVDLG